MFRRKESEYTYGQSGIRHVTSRRMWRYRSVRGRRTIQFVAAAGLLALPMAVLAAQEGHPTGSGDQLHQDKSSTTPDQSMSPAQDNNSASQNLSVDTGNSSDQTGSTSSVTQHIAVDSSTTSSGNGSSSVNIDGKHYRVPAGGELHKSVTSGDSHTTVDVSSDGSGDASSTSSLNVQINSDTQNSSDSDP
jgi:hypothetical protein